MWHYISHLDFVDYFNLLTIFYCFNANFVSQTASKFYINFQFFFTLCTNHWTNIELSEIHFKWEISQNYWSQFLIVFHWGLLNGLILEIWLDCPRPEYHFTLLPWVLRRKHLIRTENNFKTLVGTPFWQNFTLQFSISE